MPDLNAPAVETIHSLSQYLDAQESGVPTCRERYSHEFEALSDLGQMFDKLVAAWRPRDRPLTDHERLNAVFVYSVKNQLYGNVFLLLRLRVVDALNGIRYAVEAGAIAHLLWMKPELFQTYMDAYPNINRDGTANQWKPSKKYKDAFNTGELFGHLERSLPDLGRRLRDAYAIVCHRASHAGPGILMNLKKHDGKIYYHANELDATTLDRSWAVSAIYYFDLLHVFHTILKSNMPAEHRTAFEMEMTTWKEKYLTRLAEEALMRSEQNQSRQVAHG